MVDKPHTENDHEHAQNRSNQLVIAGIKDDDEVENGDAGDQDDEPKKKRKVGFRGRWKSSSTVNRMIAIATIVAAASTLTYAVFTYLQWRTLSEQISEIKKGSTDTHDLAVAAKKQSEQAEAQTQKMAESLTRTDKLIGATSDLAKEAKRSADIADSAIVATRQNFTRDQRPYVWFKPQPPRFEEGKPISWNVGFVNSGRTPALNIDPCVSVWWIGQPIKEDDLTDEIINAQCALVAQTSPGAHAPLFPGDNDFSTVNTRKSFSADELKITKERDAMLFLTAQITYEDAFGNHYHTTLCLSRLATGALQVCLKHNEMK